MIGSQQWMYSSGYADDTDYDDDYYSYKVNNSLRLEDADSANLSRTFSSGNRQTWSYSLWYKPSVRGGTQRLIRTVGAGGWGVESTAMLLSDGTLDFLFDYNGGNRLRLITESNFRDPAKWYHFLFIADTTNATANNRLRIYVNGERVDSFSTKNMPSQNYSGMINYAASHGIGDSTGYLDGHIAEVNFIDGTALPAAVFGEYGSYNDWRPIAYNTSNGGYGTNGFYLKFANSGSLGTDSSGEGHNWTANNLAATDQSIDTPTNTFNCFNAVHLSTLNTTLRQGNLGVSDNGGDWSQAYTTQALRTGKWYVEFCDTNGSGSFFFGLTTESTHNNKAVNFNNYYVGSQTNDFGFRVNDYGAGSGNNEGYSTGGSFTSLGTAQPATDNIYQMKIDMDNRKVYFGKNNTFYNSGNGISISATEDYFVTVSIQDQTNESVVMNAGQDSSFAGHVTAQNNQDRRSQGDFYYTPDIPYLAMCTANMAKPAVNPKENFNTLLYTGTGSNGNNITGLGFRANFAWFKDRAFAAHTIHNSVSGSRYYLASNNTEGQGNRSTRLQSFNSSGYTVGDGNGTSGAYINSSGNSYVVWGWKGAGDTQDLDGGGTTNNDGTISSTTSTNVDGGFSIFKWTQTGYTDSVGHGLSKTPEVIIVKSVNGSSGWWVYTKGNGTGKGLRLDTNDAVTGTSSHFPTVDSSKFVIGSEVYTGGSNIGYTGLAMHSVEGFSKFGTYKGTSDSDGPIVNLGFRPAWIMVKRVDAAHDWVIVDNKRGNNYEGWDGSISFLEANTEDAEDTDPCIDMLSYGFKVRDTALRYNDNGDTYEYFAFAETPFKYSNAR